MCVCVCLCVCVCVFVGSEILGTGGVLLHFFHQLKELHLGSGTNCISSEENVHCERKQR